MTPRHAEAEANVSADARNLCQLMLRKDPRARFTSYQTLHHKWMQKATPKLANIPLPRETIDKLKQFRRLNKLKQASLRIIASILNEDETAPIRKMFGALDGNGDGVLSVPEFQDWMKANPSNVLTDDDLKAMFRDPFSPNPDAQKGFHYTEFLAATIDRDTKTLREDICRVAFDAFDSNKDGSISISELSMGYQLGDLSLEELGAILEDLDENNDSEIDFKEFMAMLMAS